MSVSHRARAVDKALAVKRVIFASVATLLLMAFAMVAVPMQAGATAPPPGGWVHHHRPHFIHPSEFTQNSAFFPLKSPPVASTASKSLALNAKTGNVTGARALPAAVPAVIPAGASLVVDTTTDAQLKSPGAVCIDTNNKCSLRAAVEAADYLGEKTPPEAATITLPAGTYILTGAEGGEIYIENSAGVTINGAGASSTSIASDGSDRVIGVGEESSVGTPFALNGVTVTGGSASDEKILESPQSATQPRVNENNDEGCGGGIMQEDSNDVLQLSNDNISGNSATNAGGGICADGTLYAQNTTITNNTVADPDFANGEDIIGGGLVTGWDDIAAALLTNVTITNNTVRNSASSANDENGDFGAGGGAGFLYGSVATVTNSTISGNTVESAGSTCGTTDNEDDFCGFEGGGGIFTEYANTSITGTTIADNTVKQSVPCADDCDFGALGGGVLNNGGASMSNDTVTGNVATTGANGNDSMNAAEGGGIATYSPLTVASSTISGNQVVGATDPEDDCSITGGAGIYAAAPGFALTGSTVSDNSAVNGAGAGLVSWDPDSYSDAAPVENDLNGNQLVNDQIVNNKSTSAVTDEPYDFGSGAGVYVEDDSIQITGTSIEGNTAQGYGGGLWVDDSLVSLQASTIANNTASIGGGVLETYDAVLSATNSTIADNTATATTECSNCEGSPPGGGGIYGIDGSLLALTYDTISGNIAPAGAGIYFPSGENAGTIVGTIVAGNSAKAGGADADCSIAPSKGAILLTSGGWNLSGDASCGLAQPTDLVSVNPELGALANNGGPTETMLPTRTSPVVDAGGSPAACPATDQRGITRPQGKACDIGAVELFVPPAGYWIVGSDGGVFAFGGASFFGSAGGPGLNAPAIGIAPTPDEGGYWIASSNGGVVPFGDAGKFGTLEGTVLNAPIVGIAGTPDGQGYWLVGADGGIFAFGDAGYYGSMGGLPLNQPIVGIASTPDGAGYWLVASDGGIFSFGDAAFYGSTGGVTLNAPVVGIAATPDGAGYWLVASDGGIFSFGDAPFLGSTGGLTLNEPIVGMAPTFDGNGYYLTAKDGGIFSFGDAAFEGSLPSMGVQINDGAGIAAT